MAKSSNLTIHFTFLNIIILIPQRSEFSSYLSFAGGEPEVGGRHYGAQGLFPVLYSGIISGQLWGSSDA